MNVGDHDLSEEKDCLFGGRKYRKCLPQIQLLPVQEIIIDNLSNTIKNQFISRNNEYEK